MHEKLDKNSSCFNSPKSFIPILLIAYYNFYDPCEEKNVG